MSLHSLTGSFFENFNRAVIKAPHLLGAVLILAILWPATLLDAAQARPLSD